MKIPKNNSTFEYFRSLEKLKQKRILFIPPIIIQAFEKTTLTSPTFSKEHAEKPNVENLDRGVTIENEIEREKVEIIEKYSFIATELDGKTSLKVKVNIYENKWFKEFMLNIWLLIGTKQVDI